MLMLDKEINLDFIRKMFELFVNTRVKIENEILTLLNDYVHSGAKENSLKGTKNYFMYIVALLLVRFLLLNII